MEQFCACLSFKWGLKTRVPLPLRYSVASPLLFHDCQKLPLSYSVLHILHSAAAGKHLIGFPRVSVQILKAKRIAWAKAMSYATQCNNRGIINIHLFSQKELPNYNIFDIFVLNAWLKETGWLTVDYALVKFTPSVIPRVFVSKFIQHSFNDLSETIFCSFWATGHFLRICLAIRVFQSS